MLIALSLIVFIGFLLVGHSFVNRSVRRNRLAWFTVLRLLIASNAPITGLDLVKRSGGILRRGHVYVVLGTLEDHDLIRRVRSDGYGRYWYEPTSGGIEAYRKVFERREALGLAIDEA